MKRMVDGITYRYFSDSNLVHIFPLVPGTCTAEVKTTDDGDGALRTLTLKGTLRTITKCPVGPVRLHVYYDDGHMDWFGTEDLPLFIDVTSGTGGCSFSIKYSF